jgi:uncharacterized HAD superfamily protein
MQRERLEKLIKDSTGKIIAVDVDGTLCVEQCWCPNDVLDATPIKKNIFMVNRLHVKNFIIIYTARRDEMMSNTLIWLKKHNVRYHAVSNHKIPFDFYLDTIAREMEV